MTPARNEVESLTNFKRRTATLLKRMKKTGQPVVLTIKGKAELIVQDAASYQRLLDVLDRLEAIEGIERGLRDLDTGRVRPIEEVIKDMKSRHGL